MTTQVLVADLHEVIGRDVRYLREYRTNTLHTGIVSSSMVYWSPYVRKVTLANKRPILVSTGETRADGTREAYRVTVA